MKYSIIGVEGYENTNISHYVQSNNVYITENSLYQNKTQIIIDLFSSILNRDLSKHKITIDQFIIADDKTNFLINYDIPIERVDEMKSLINDFVLSSEEHFWWTILNLKDTVDFDKNIFEKKFNILQEQYHLSNDKKEKLVDNSKKINFDNINDKKNISHIYEIFNILNISLDKFNSQSTNKISFINVHIKEIEKIINKNEHIIKELIYIAIKQKNDINYMERFQEILDDYDNLINSVELNENEIKINYEQHFIKLLNGQFSDLKIFTEDDLKYQRTFNLSQIFKENLNKLKSSFSNKVVDDNKILENKKFRSLLYFDYRLLIEESDYFIISSNNEFSKNEKEKKLTNIPGLKVGTKPRYKKIVSKGNDSNRKGRRINGNKYSKEQQKIGLIAEKTVYEYLKNKNVKNLIWVSKNATKDENFIGYNPEGNDELGYDIEYLDKNYNKIFVEVKGRSGKELSFHLSSKEKNVALSHKDNYKIIFVSGIKTDNPIIYDLGFLFNFANNENFYNNSKFNIIENDFIIEFDIKN